MITAKYTVPVLCDAGGDTNKEWYVYFEFEHAGKIYERKKREGINRIKDRKQRTLEGTALANARHDWLKAGWNPITDPEFKQRYIKKDAPVTAETIGHMSIVDALRWALKCKKLAKKSREGYQSQINHIEQAIIGMSYDRVEIANFDTFGVLQLLSEIEIGKAEANRKDPQKFKKLSNHGYNKYKGTISAMCAELRKRRIIKHNPAAELEERPVAESTKYQTYTLEEKQIIAEYLQAYHFRYFVYFLVIYHTGIRPKEVLALKIPDIKLSERIISIIPVEGTENAKTLKNREVPICDELFFYLNELNLDIYPRDYYVFGSPFSTHGNRGEGSARQLAADGKIRKVVGAKRSNYFFPSLVQIKRDTVTRLWREIVMKLLGINKYLYAAKHTGGDDKILSGVDLRALQQLYGHGNPRMTEIYAKKIKEVYKREIITKTRSFTAPRPIE